MAANRHFWGPRDEQSALVLTAAFQFTGPIDIQDGFAVANTSVYKHCLVSYAVQYSGGTASVGRAEVVVEWSHAGGAGPWFRPATDAEVMLEVADGSGDRNNIVGVGTPGGVRFVRFGIREIGDAGNPGTVTTQSAGEFPL